MKDIENYGPVCFRCERAAKPKDKIYTMLICLEEYQADHTVKVIDEYPIVQICSDCAMGMLIDSVINEKLLRNKVEDAFFIDRDYNNSEGDGSSINEVLSEIILKYANREAQWN